MFGLCYTLLKEGLRRGKGGEKASVSAIYTAHHYAEGTGKVKGATTFVTGGLYYLDLVKVKGEGEGGEEWRIEVFKMKSIWSEGDVRIMGHD